MAFSIYVINASEQYLYQVRYFMFSLKYMLFSLLNHFNKTTAMPLLVHLLVCLGRPSIFLSLWKKVTHRNVCNTIFKIKNEEILQHLILLFYFLELEYFIWLKKTTENSEFIFCVSLNSIKESLQKHRENIPKIESILIMHILYTLFNNTIYMKYRDSLKVNFHCLWYA